MRSSRSVLSEDEVLQRIQQIARDLKAGSGLRLSIGDDAAAFRPSARHLTLISTDALVENVHFDLRYFSPADLGWKALAVNLSDIAAMGGRPLYATTSIAFPRGLTARFVEDFYKGLASLAKQHGVVLIGGDTCSSQRDIFVDVTVIGEIEPAKIVTRSGARPGDLLYVTGALGGSAMGLEWLTRSSTNAWGALAKRRKSSLVQRHLRPEPRCAAGRFLADRRLPSAMIDVSDGLSTDLGHLCQQSQVGAIVDAKRIPLPKSSSLSIPQLHDWLGYALNGGEDYELLFAVPSRRRKKVPRAIQGLPIHEIGFFTSRPGTWLVQGDQQTEFFPSGFDHFRESSNPDR
jgi:thiamine-monophosphate kinase